MDNEPIYITLCIIALIIIIAVKRLIAMRRVRFEEFTKLIDKASRYSSLSALLISFREDTSFIKRYLSSNDWVEKKKDLDPEDRTMLDQFLSNEITADMLLSKIEPKLDRMIKRRDELINFLGISL